MSFAYDALGRLTNMVDAVGTTIYAYANGLLQYEGGPWTTGTNGWTDRVTYGYDAAWNMLKRTNNNTTVSTYSPNVLNQAAGSYDSNGNRTSTSAGEMLVYDAQDQLVTMYQTNTWRVDFVYDGHQRLRVIKDYTAGSGGSWLLQKETRLLYDGMLLVQERSSAGHPQVTYTRGRDLSGKFAGAGGIGGLLARSTHATSSPYQPNSHAFYHADGNGNVTFLSQSNGSTVGGYKYDPFGRGLATTGTLAAQNRLRFSSKLWVQSGSGGTALYYYGYRFYDPLSQRWLNRDPLGDIGSPRSVRTLVTGKQVTHGELLQGSNLYAMCGNASVINFDTDGRLVPQLLVLLGYGAWAVVCQSIAINEAEKAYDGTRDPDFDKKKHCFTSCYFNKCMLSAPGATLIGGILHEVMTSNDLSRSVQDEKANLDGLMGSYAGSASGMDCKTWCDACPVKGDNAW